VSSILESERATTVDGGVTTVGAAGSLNIKQVEAARHRPDRQQIKVHAVRTFMPLRWQRTCVGRLLGLPLGLFVLIDKLLKLLVELLNLIAVVLVHL
jgi:hypothetical protein